MKRIFAAVLLAFSCFGLSASTVLADPVADVDAAKAALTASPDNPGLRRDLGEAYYHAGNDFWAVRTLGALVEENPADCDARVWLGLALLRRAFPDQALAAVRAGGCEGPVLLRLAFVEALALKAAGHNEDADRTVADAAGLPSGWQGDVDSFPAMRRRMNPDYSPEVTWMLEAGGGYTTNAAMGSATDASGGAGDDPSALSTVDARLRLSPDFGGAVRGVLEIQPKFHWFFGESARKLSFFEVTGQVGVTIRSTLPRVFLGYRPDYLVLPGGFRADSGPVSYMSSHRGEFEVEVRPEVLIFGGAGTRTFAERVRTRSEVDLGLGGSSSPVRDLTVLWAASARYYDARHDAWDLFGGSAMFAAVMRLPHDLSARVSATLSMDWYYDSAATVLADPFQSDENRLDYLFKVGGQLWAPSLAGVRFGLTYDYSGRESTAELYSYTDHRVMLKVRWNGSAAMKLPAAMPLPDDVGSVDWGTDEGGGMDERVQDMLRQDEQVQRSSSCVN